MIKRLLTLCVCLSLMGCASFQKIHDNDEYEAMYTEALIDGTNTSIIEEADFRELKERVKGFFRMRDYYDVVYSSPGQGFDVINKAYPENFLARLSGPNSCQIIYKYTKMADGKFRIDLMRGSNFKLTNDEVDEDIKEIAYLLKIN